MIEIDSTTLGAEKRAKKLSASTSVPTLFEVAYEIYVDNCTKLEKQIHKGRVYCRPFKRSDYYQDRLRVYY